MKTTSVTLLACLLSVVPGCGGGDSGAGNGGAGGSNGGTAGSTGGTAGSTGGSAGATGGSAGATGGAGGSGGAATISYLASITGNATPDPPSQPDWQELGPISGMKICLENDTTKCATTDSKGLVLLAGVPASSNVAITFTHADYGTWLLQYVTKTDTFLTSPTFTTASARDKLLAAAGCASPLASGQGMIIFGIPTGSIVTLTPPHKVVYWKNGVPDPTLTSAWGTFAMACDLAPGKYVEDVTGTAGKCGMWEGWPSTGHDIEAVVDADTVTLTNWFCQ